MARQKEPRISRGTVYRNLNLLAEMGEISRLSMPNTPDHFDCNPTHHYHFLCRKCNKVVDIALPYKAMLDETPVDLSDYVIEWHRLILVGLCPDCNH